MAGHHNTPFSKKRKPAEPRRVSARCQAWMREHVDQWVLEYGLVCPGHARSSHTVESASDLQADHVFPLHDGGSEWGPLRVLCSKCNNSRHSRTRDDSYDDSTGGATDRGY